ncbi:hypothetical protein RJT34_33316 [Clitoria ternatea]|uniref:Kinesin light chain n=1 Tax=Clitoria ternatea TaxID=43366 RepID=A0AAN9F057_CLITE
MPRGIGRVVLRREEKKQSCRLRGWFGKNYPDIPFHSIPTLQNENLSFSILFFLHLILSLVLLLFVKGTRSKMPGIVTIEAHGEGGVNRMNVVGKSFPFKETSTATKSPRSTLRPPRYRSGGRKPSVEGLYDNGSDVQSSDQSFSSQSFGSDDDFRVDSELDHVVVGGQVKQEVEKKNKGDSSSEASSAIANPVISEKANKASNSHLAPETSLKSISKGKSPPVEKKNDNNPVRKQYIGVNLVKRSVGRLLSRSTESVFNNPELGPVLLKQARDIISSGDNPQKALELALQAMKLYEKAANGKPSLELVMCLHVTAAIYCNLGRYLEAIPIIKRSIEIPVVELGQQHATAKFAGHMQLGDIYATVGQLQNSIRCYNAGLELQMQVLGETDPRVGETCRYVAEANFQALQFDEAERLCQMALDIHRENDSPLSLEEAADRRLMGLICEANGHHEAALEHLVLASMAMVDNGQEVEVASVDCSIGDTFSSLARYDEATLAYRRAIKVFKKHKGENHPAVGLVYVRLADLHNRTWKIKESKSYCESALKIYENPMPGVPPEEIATGFMNVSAIYESMNDLERALKLLRKAIEVYNGAPGQQGTVAGIEAQMGVMYYMLGNYNESYKALRNAVSKLRAIGDKKSALFGTILNQMGLACVHRHSLHEAAELFEEARAVLEQENGPYHPETLGVYSNLAGTYDALGRVKEAIEILEYIVDMREEKLGTANPDVADEKRRLDELLKETGRVRKRKAMSLEHLLEAKSLMNLLDSNGETDGNLIWLVS